MNKQLGVFCVVLSCLAAPACIAKADPKLPPPVGAAQALSEKDVLGEWQTRSEGWKITLNADHSVAVYFEGFYESRPSFTTWKLAGSHVIIADASLFKAGMLEDLGGDFVVIPFQNQFVLLPKKELLVAEKRGFAVCMCFWHFTQKANTERK